jgi:hypothetical protein
MEYSFSKACEKNPIASLNRRSNAAQPGCASSGASKVATQAKGAGARDPICRDNPRMKNGDFRHTYVTRRAAREIVTHEQDQPARRHVAWSV